MDCTDPIVEVAREDLARRRPRQRRTVAVWYVCCVVVVLCAGARAQEPQEPQEPVDHVLAPTPAAAETQPAIELGLPAAGPENGLDAEDPSAPAELEAQLDAELDLPPVDALDPVDPVDSVNMSAPGTPVVQPNAEPVQPPADAVGADETSPPVAPAAQPAAELGLPPVDAVAPEAPVAQPGAEPGLQPDAAGRVDAVDAMDAMDLANAETPAAPVAEATENRLPQPFRTLFFLKFHKTGSSTAALQLARIAVNLGLHPDCTNAGDRSFCVEHYSLKLTRNETLGRNAIERIETLFPQPFLITVLREPLEKFTSWIYYWAWINGETPGEVWFSQNIDLLFNQSAEYEKMLGQTVKDVTFPTLAVRVLESFNVVGITEDLPGMFAQIAHHLGLTSREVAYTSVTVVPDRPVLTDLSENFQIQAYKQLVDMHQGDIVVYSRARELHYERIDQFQLLDLRDEIRSQAQEPGETDCSGHYRQPGVKAGGVPCIDVTAPRSVV